MKTMYTYKGFNIFKSDFNASGIKWYCRTNSGILRADTLAGMRKLINMQYITVSQHVKNEWSRFAQAAYNNDHNSIGHRFSRYSAIPNDAQITLAVFDTLQRSYRAWLVFNDFEFHEQTECAL